MFVGEQLVMIYGRYAEEGYSDYRLMIFDSENVETDEESVAAFAMMWPDAIYFYVTIS